MPYGLPVGWVLIVGALLFPVFVLPVVVGAGPVITFAVFVGGVALFGLLAG